MQRLGIRFEVTEAILNHIGSSRLGVAGIYQRHDWPAEKAAALKAWSDHITAILTERGHKVSVVEQEFSVDPAASVTEAMISLHIVPSGTQSTVHDERGRALSISTRHYNKTVSINTGRPQEVSKGIYSLEKIDRELVEAELIGFVASMVAG